MQIKVNFFNQVIPDQYGCNTDKLSLNHGINQTSFPFEIVDIPKDTKYLSWSLIDYDTIPLLGFAWIHWLVADNPVHQSHLTIESNFSQLTTVPQGTNSLNSVIQRLRRPLWKRAAFNQTLITHYSGPRPKTGRHTYRLTVYATTKPLNLKNGFGQNELINSIDPVLIEQTSLNLSYERRN